MDNDETREFHECPNCGETFHEDDMVYDGAWWICKSCDDVRINPQDYK